MTYFECLQRLWTRMQNERIHVEYVERPATGEDGMCHPPDRIDICRDLVPEPKDEPNDSSPVYDLCVLAHEYGHYLIGLLEKWGGSPLEGQILAFPRASP
jgi:hypothetical protein